MAEDPMKPIESGIAVVSELMKAARKDPQVKEAASNLGQTAVTVTRALNNVLLPLAAMNYAFDKAKVYFYEKFPSELSEKVGKIPEDKIQEPKASVAGPALQGLAFTHEEPPLKEMFLNLLATSMDARHSSQAHPAFVEVIKQLEAKEASMVQDILKPGIMLPIVQVYIENVSTGGQITKITHLANLKDSESGGVSVEEGFPAMVDNWIRLGLVNVEYDKSLVGEHYYSWVENRPEYIDIVNKVENKAHRVGFKKGVITATDFGKEFAKAVS